MHIKKVLNMKKTLFIQIFLILTMVIFGLNVGVTRVFAAGEASETYAIYIDGDWHSCNSSGGNIGEIMNSKACENITYAFIDGDATIVQNMVPSEFTKLKKIVFMWNKVTDIDNRAFWKSQALTNVIIPESVNKIGSDVFYNCANLTNVAILNKETVWNNPSSPTTFVGTNSNLRVYVYPANENMTYIEGTKVPHKTVIAPPADLKVDLSEDGITLNWTANTDATSYKVFRADMQDGIYTQLIDNTTSTTYTDKTADKTGEYKYKVSSVYDTKKISNWENGPVLESEPKVVKAFFITEVSSERDSTKVAIVEFTSNDRGQYYYAVVGDGDAQPSIDTNTTGTSCIYGENRIKLTNLTAGAKDIYIVVKNQLGILSNVLKVDIDYDDTKLHKVIYDGNGNTAGSIPAEASYLRRDKVMIAKQGDLLKSGYSFLGWNTKQDGTGTAYKPDETITIGTEDVTLYAQWNIISIPVSTITLNESTMNLTIGETKTLTADITPSDATNKKIIWSSSDSKVATVENGVVTPVTEGTATITATTEDESKTASCEVAVIAKDCPITYQGAQKTATGDICFLATINTLDADEVGFVFSKSKKVPVKGQVKASNIKSTTKVYKSVKAEDLNITAASFTNGGTYIVACTVTGIPAKEVDMPLYVRAFSTKGSETKYTEVHTVTAKGIK